MIAWAVRRPAVIWAACAIVLIGGAVSFTRLALATRTAVELPRLQISSSWSGASAELVESYLTSPIEAAVQGVRGVRRTESTSSDDAARIEVELHPTADVRLARLAILERLELLRKDFPPGASAPTVSNWVPEELEEEPLLRVTVSGPYTPGALQRLLRDRIEPRLSAVRGVSGLDARGGASLGVAVTYDAGRLRQLGIPPERLSQAVAGARVVRALGEMRTTDSGRVTLRAVVLNDQPAVVEALGALPVQGMGRQRFALRELATVRVDEDTRGLFYRINGSPAVALAIARQPEADAIQTSRRVRDEIARLEPTLPPGVQMRIARDESEGLKKELDELLRRGGYAFAAVMLVLAVTLRDARAVLLVMGSTAVAIAGTAFCLYLLGVPANLLTLAGLGMGIGVLVQNPLVVVERMGRTANTPAGRVAAARGITAAVIGATLTTAVVLIPFLYLQGDTRAAFVPFASAFALALAWSVVTALVVVPALSRGVGKGARHWRRPFRFYGQLVGGIVRFRRTTMFCTVVVLGVLGWAGWKKVPRSSFGGFGDQRTTLGASLFFPRGSDAITLDRTMREFEQLVVGVPEVELVTSQSYGSLGAGMNVLFTRAGGLTAVPQQLEEALTQRAVLVGGASVSVRGSGPGFSSGSGGSSLASFRIRILGFSYAGVEQLATDLKARLERIPRVRDVDINAAAFFGSQKGTQVVLEPDRAVLARFGLNAKQFTDALAREVRGPVGRQLLEINGEELPVTVKASGARERSLDELREAIVPTATAAPVRIGDLAGVEERVAPGTITREDQQYVRIVAYDFRGPGKLAQRTHDAFMKGISVPAGYSVADASSGYGRDDESSKGLWLVFGIGLALVLLSVAVVFDSVWGTMLVFASLPLALCGVVAAFWMTGGAFTREAAVGVILVIGLAVNQAILLVDAALVVRRRATARGLEAGASPRTVLRAALDRSGMIVLVTLTALASLIPLSVGTDASSLFGAIALATIGGTVAGTLGTMVVLPALLVGRRQGGGGGRAASA
jgi:hydrophobic/amphiphilic exporter-1 (mainly G- bacteria), HAE1 family